MKLILEKMLRSIDIFLSSNFKKIEVKFLFKNTTKDYHRKENTLWKIKTFANRLIQLKENHF